MDDLHAALRAAGWHAIPAGAWFGGRRRSWPYVLIPRWGIAATLGRREPRDRMRDLTLQREGWLVVRSLTVGGVIAQVAAEIGAMRERAPA